MAAEAIANIDSYIWVAVGLFIAGLFTTMVYAGTSSKSKQQHTNVSADTK